MTGKLMTWLAVVLTVAVGAPAQAQLPPLERIGIRPGEDGAQFVLKESEAPFFVKGFNYIRLRAAAGKTGGRTAGHLRANARDASTRSRWSLESAQENKVSTTSRTGGDHATFDADTSSTKAHYDCDRAEAMFSALSEAGYNTVRVFIIGRSKINPGIAGNYDTTTTLHEPYMENVLDFLRRATRHRIRVFPTFGDGGVPLNAYYRERLRGRSHNKNVFVLTEEGIAARVEHITSFLSYIKNNEPALLPTLLGLECQNEAYLRANAWPFIEKEGTFQAANGKTYDLSKTCLLYKSPSPRDS